MWLISNCVNITAFKVKFLATNMNENGLFFFASSGTFSLGKTNKNSKYDKNK